MKPQKLSHLVHSLEMKMTKLDAPTVAICGHGSRPTWGIPPEHLFLGLQAGGGLPRMSTLGA